MRIEERDYYNLDKEVDNALKTFLMIEDLEESTKTFLKMQGCIYPKQLDILIKKGNLIGANNFYEIFVEKYGVPKIGERGFSASAEQFVKYYFEDLIFELKKSKK
jgi:hypothetical protein